LVPIIKGTKKPACAWGRLQNERVTLEELDGWFSDDRHTYAIVTGAISGVVVVDCDTPAAIEWAKENLTPSPLVVQTRKGEHWYYRHPGVKVQNRVRLETDDKKIELDVKGDGGLCMGPFAVHESGAIYQPIGWKAIFDGPGWDAVPIFDLSWLPAKPMWEPRTVSVATTDTPGRPDAVSRAMALVNAIDGIGQGGRNHAAYKVALALAQGFELDNSSGWDLLCVWNGKNDPPLRESELSSCWQSACRAQIPDRGWLLHESRELPERAHPETYTGEIPQEKPSAETWAEQLSKSQNRLELDTVAAGSQSGDRVVFLSVLELEDLEDDLAVQWMLACRAILADGLKPSAGLMRQRLANMGQLESSKRYEEHCRIIQAQDVSIADLSEWIEAVKASACRRRLRRSAREIDRLAGDPTSGLLHLQEKVPELVSRAFREGRGFGVESIQQVASAYAQELTDKAMAKEQGIPVGVRPTGFARLDALLYEGGCLGGQFVLIAAPSGSGKSSLALQMAGSFSRTGPVLIWSGEMSKRQVTRRRACQVLRVRSKSITAGQILEFAETSEDQLEITEQTNVTIHSLANELRLFRLRHPDMAGALIDYVGLLADNRDRVASITEISKTIKKLAMELQVPIIGIHMQNEEAAKRLDKRPQLGDIRDSKQLVYDSDLILMLYRLSKYKCELWIRKQREGISDVHVPLDMDLDCYRFDDAKPPKRTETPILDGIDPEKIPF
jgi:replicative DNA helicase